MMQTLDPKRFPSFLRWLALASLNLYVFMSNMYTSGIATGFAEVAATFHIQIAAVSSIVVWSLLAQGLSNLFWMPAALCFGKRPTILLAMSWFLVGIIWSIEAKSFNELLAARIFANFGAGAVESLGPSIIADIFYEKNYSAAMATYAVALSGGSQIGPLIAGYLIQAAGWRWFFILCAIMLAVNLLFCIFLLPETTYEPVEQLENEASYTEKPENEDMDMVPAADPSLVASEMTMDYKQYFRGLFRLSITRAARERGIFEYYMFLFALPLPLLLCPAMLIASLAFGAVLGGVVAMSTLNPEIFSPPPYSFTASDLGLLTFSSFIGVVIAWPVAGVLTDRFSLWMRKRNNDRHKPEHRIPIMIVPFLVCPVGLIIYAYTASRHEHFVYPAIGAAIATSGLSMVPAIMLSYIVDAYPDVAGEALVLINCCKNVIAFGLSKSGNAWMVEAGLQNMFFELAGIEWALLLLPLTLYFVGPWMRVQTNRLLSFVRRETFIGEAEVRF